MNCNDCVVLVGINFIPCKAHQPRVQCSKCGVWSFFAPMRLDGARHLPYMVSMDNNWECQSENDCYRRSIMRMGPVADSRALAEPICRAYTMQSIADLPDPPPGMMKCYDAEDGTLKEVV